MKQNTSRIVLASLLVCSVMAASAETILYSQDFSSNTGTSYAFGGGWGQVGPGEGLVNDYAFWTASRGGITVTENVNGTLEISNADASFGLSGEEAISFKSVAGVSGVMTGQPLSEFRLSFDYMSLTGTDVGMIARLCNGSWAQAVGDTGLTATGTMQTYSATLDTMTDWGSFAVGLDNVDWDWSMQFGSSSDVGMGEGFIIDNIQISQIPEPATIGLFGLIGGAMIGVRRLFLS